MNEAFAQIMNYDCFSMNLTFKNKVCILKKTYLGVNEASK